MLYFSRPSKKCVKVQVHSVVSNSLQPPGLYSPWNSLRQNSGMDSLSLLQGIFPIQGSNQGLPHCRQTLYQLSHREALKKRNVYKEINNSSICVCVCVQTLFCVQLFASPWTVAHQAPLFMCLSGQEYWSCFSYPPPADLLNKGLNPYFLSESLALAGRFFYYLVQLLPKKLKLNHSMKTYNTF